MKKISFHEAVEKIAASRKEYDAQVYYFMREALDFTIKLFEKPTAGAGRHVSGGELLDGIRKYALQEFGPMTKTVLNRWGVTRCEDFGEVVFLMVEKGILGKTDEDRKEDFAGGYDFDTAFSQPFRPAKKPAAKEPSTTTAPC